MKYFILSFALLLWGAGALAQDTIKGKVATLSLSKNVQKLKEYDYVALGKKNFGKTNAFLKGDNAYSSDGMLVLLGERERSSSLKTLESWKAELEGVFHIKPNNSTIVLSKIVTINNKKFLIFETAQEENHRLSFYSDYIGDKSFMGLIDFKKADNKTAHKYFEDLLKNIRFTDDILN